MRALLIDNKETDAVNELLMERMQQDTRINVSTSQGMTLSTRLEKKDKHRNRRMEETVSESPLGKTLVLGKKVCPIERISSPPKTLSR